MRARLHSPVRMLLVLQAEQRTGRVIWRSLAGERGLLMSGGLVVGTEGQPESFLQYLARATHISPTTLGRIERRVQDLFLPLEDEVVRATGQTREELAAARRAFTLEQIADLCLTDDDAVELKFRIEEIPIPGAACQVPPATALADLLVDRVTRGLLALTFPTGELRPTRMFPRLGPLLEASFPWHLPLPRAGGESAAELLTRAGPDRAPALWLLVTGGLLAEETTPAERKRIATVMPGMLLPAAVAADPHAAFEAFEQRLAVDPFNQDAIEALEHLAADEGWPEVLVDMQERLAAKAPPPQRGFHYLRLAALAEIAGLPTERITEIVLLGRRSLPHDLRLISAQACHALFRGEPDTARNLLQLARIPWSPVLDAPASVRSTIPGVPPALPAETTPGPGHEPRAPAVPPPAGAATETPLPPRSATVTAPLLPPARPVARPADDAADLELSGLPDSLGPLMAALHAGDEDTLHTWLQHSLPQLPRVRRASQAILDASTTPGAESTDHVARFARALGRALDHLPATDTSPAAGTLRAELFLQLAGLLKPIDTRAALVAAERAVAAAPEHEPALERFERLATEAKDAEAYARGFAGAEQRLEGAHNRWAFAYRQGRTLETEFARNDLALQAYLRALAHQPRTGAVLTAIERIAKAQDSEEPLVAAYRTLATGTDGAQRAYWRSRLVALGASPTIGDDSAGWSDMLEESLAGPGKPAAPAPAAEPPPTAPGEPARGIEEALLRATPALGIPIPFIALQGERTTPPPPAEPAPTPPSEAEPAAEAAAPSVAPVSEPPAPELPLAAPPTPELPLAAPPTPELPPAAPPAPELPLAAPPAPELPPAAPPTPELPPAAAEPAALPPTAPPPPELPPTAPPAPELAPTAAEPAVLPPTAPPAPELAPTVAKPAVLPPTAPPAPELAPTATAEAASDEPPLEAATRDVSWLDDDVEMLIEYPPEEEEAIRPAADIEVAAGERSASIGPAAPTETSEGHRPAVLLEAPAAREVRAAEPPEVQEARERLAADITDLEALRVLQRFWKAGNSPGGLWAAESILSVFDRSMWPTPPPPAIASPAEVVLTRCGPWAAQFMHRAAALVWEHCAATFAEDLGSAARPADQVSPLGNDPLARGIAECSDRLAFFRFQVYRRAAQSELQVLRTRPPSVLAGAHLQPVPGRPSNLTVLATGVARCLPEHVLPATLAPAEREALLQGLLCAFGPPGCMPRIPPRAAAVAQDLWHFLPSRAQAQLRQEFAHADVAVANEWLTEVQARCLLLGIHVSRDIRTGIRHGLALDAAVPLERPLTEAEFRDGLRWSSVTRRLMRAVLAEPFWLAFFR